MLEIINRGRQDEGHRTHPAEEESEAQKDENAL